MVKSPLIFISTNYQSVYMSLLWKLYYSLKLTMEMIWEIILCHDFQFTPLISVTFYGNDTMP